MILKIERLQDANVIAEALQRVYPSYKYEVNREKGCRAWTIRVYCAVTGALLKTRAEV